MAQPALVPDPPPHIKLDLGAGKVRHAPDFTTVDIRAFDGVDVVCDLSKDRWPWEDSSVQEVFCSHFLEHLTAPERIHFFNELHRVLLPGRSAMIITPHWNSCRAYGDMTHQWPPVSEFAYFYLNKAWRDANAPHCDAYTCDFGPPMMGHNLRPDLNVRNEEYKQFAVANWKEAAQDLVCTISKL